MRGILSPKSLLRGHSCGGNGWTPIAQGGRFLTSRDVDRNQELSLAQGESHRAFASEAWSLLVLVNAMKTQGPS